MVFPLTIGGFFYILIEYFSLLIGGILDRLSQQQDSKFRLCILAAKRAKQLVNGAKKKLDIKAENPLTIAIAEIRAGIINFHVLDEEEEKRLRQQALFADEAADLLDDETPGFNFSRVPAEDDEDEDDDREDSDLDEDIDIDLETDEDEEEDDDEREFLLDGEDEDEEEEEELDDF